MVTWLRIRLCIRICFKRTDHVMQRVVRCSMPCTWYVGKVQVGGCVQEVQAQVQVKMRASVARGARRVDKAGRERFRRRGRGRSGCRCSKGAGTGGGVGTYAGANSNGRAEHMQEQLRPIRWNAATGGRTWREFKDKGRYGRRLEDGMAHEDTWRNLETSGKKQERKNYQY